MANRSSDVLNFSEFLWTLPMTA